MGRQPLRPRFRGTAHGLASLLVLALLASATSRAAAHAWERFVVPGADVAERLDTELQLADAELAAVGAALRAQTPLPPELAAHRVGACAETRRRGLRLAEACALEGDLAATLSTLRGRLQAMAKADGPFIAEDDVLLVSLLFRPRTIAWDSWAVDRGVDGTLVTVGDRTLLFPPPAWMSRNYKWRHFQGRIEELFPEAFVGGATGLEAFETDAYTFLHQPEGVVRLRRGDVPIGPQAVDRARVIRFRDDAADWMLRQLQSDGRLEYKYFPSSGRYSDANNMIRQWMATLAFAEMYRATGDARFADAWQRNIDYDLFRFYRTHTASSVMDIDPHDPAPARSSLFAAPQLRFGYILFDGKAKLGAAAIAAMAIMRGPDPDRYAEELEALLTFIREVCYNLEDGSFETFFLPEDRDDNHAFYPGEALLALSMRYEQTGEPALAGMIARSRDYYMRWWRENRRVTAFVPWHTMAYYRMYRTTGDPAYKAAIYELNDWLVQTQDIRSVHRPMVMGRYYLRETAWHGPPHASATAVYSEGLAYAVRLAAEEADELRTARYAQALLWGWRSLIQLQFRPENAWYIAEDDLPKVLGGLRTTVTDNVLRIDNTQHAIMAALAAFPAAE